MPGPLRLFPQIKGGEQCGDPISESWGVTKMMSFVSLLLVGILFHATQAEQLTKCEVFRELKDLKGYGGVSLPEWVCTTFHTSGYDTQAVVQNNDSTEYGLFQINNKIWCKDDQNPHSSNICNISCDKFLDDDLTDDIMCVKKILDKVGINYWRVPILFSTLPSSPSSELFSSTTIALFLYLLVF
uniref:Alpha-lactalbumin n=1 Tax=Bos indicus x Bos taurus TaxID=30522 RepID=A0A4W2GGM6_BOBOX